MPLQFADNTISANDNGIYAWADVVALNAPILTSLGSMWRLTGRISIGNSAILNINLQTIEIAGAAIIEAADSGTINFFSCDLIVKINYNDDQNSGISCGRTNTVSRLNLSKTKVLYSANGVSRVNIFCSSFVDCLVTGDKQASDERFVYLQANGIILDTKFENITVLEFLGIPGTLKNIAFANSNYTFLVWALFTTLLISNISAQTERSYWTNNGSFRFVDSPSLPLSNGRIQNADFVSYKAYTHSLKLISGITPVANAEVRYMGATTATIVTGASGVAEFVLDVENTSGGGDGNIQTINTSDYVRTIKSYRHLPVIENLNVTGKVGTSDLPFEYALTIDHGVTQADPAIVAAYTGIAHTPASITITANRSLAEVHDSRKLYWRNNPIDAPALSGGVADFGNVDIVINGATLTPSSKFDGGIKTLGVVSFANNGSTTVPVQDANGVRFRVFGLPAAANSVMRVKRVSTGAIVNPAVVNGEAYVTLVDGEDYEIRADARGYKPSPFVTVNTSSQLSLQITLEQYVTRDGTPAYSLGNPAIAALLTLNPATYEIFVGYSSTYPQIGIYDALRAIEDQLATPIGLEFTAQPAFESGKIVFKRDVRSGVISPVRIKPAAGNTGNPELTFEVEHEGVDLPYGLFDFSGGNGKTIYFPTTVNLAQVDGVEFDLDPQSLRNVMTLPATVAAQPGSIDDRLNRVNGLIENSGGDRFTAKALETASGGTAEIDPEAIWTYPNRSLTDKGGFSLSVAGVTAIVSAVWNAATRTLTSAVSSFSVADIWNHATRSLTDKAGFAPSAANNATAVWSAATRTLTAIDKTGYSLSPAERSTLATAIEAALINEGDGQRLIDAILQVINSNLDLPPLELTAIAQAVQSALATELARIDAPISSLPTLSQITAALPPAPNNTAIAAIKMQTDKLTFTGSDVKATLDGETVSLTTPISVPSPAANADAVRVALTPEFSNLNASIDGLPVLPQIAAILPPAPNNTAISAIKQQTDQMQFTNDKIEAIATVEDVSVDPSAVAEALLQSAEVQAALLQIGELKTYSVDRVNQLDSADIAVGTDRTYQIQVKCPDPANLQIAAVFKRQLDRPALIKKGNYGALSGITTTAIDNTTALIKLTISKEDTQALLTQVSIRTSIPLLYTLYVKTANGVEDLVALGQCTLLRTAIDSFVEVGNA